MAMYQEQDGEYVEVDKMPSSGYVINEEKSYCTIDNVNKDEESVLYTNDNGEHVISGLKKIVNVIYILMKEQNFSKMLF